MDSNVEKGQAVAAFREEVIEVIAEICHEANRVFCSQNGDLSQTSWSAAPDWQKQSARDGVTMHINNPTVSASASHEEWLDQKKREGWVYGRTKDAVAKTHPHMVPFLKLHVVQKHKYYLFRAIVHGMFHDSESEQEVVPAQTTLSAGQKTVRFNLHDNQHGAIAGLKLKAAAFIDACHDLRGQIDSENPEPNRSSEVWRMTALAITQAETAVMWAVKAATAK
jgi:hypothetical protein